jgi:excisionase family DNA binding protein
MICAGSASMFASIDSLSRRGKRTWMKSSSLTIEEAAKLTSIGRSKLYEAIGEGRLQVRKFGRRTVILRSDLEGFLAALPAGNMHLRARRLVSSP